jgi:hypothetical protein
MARPNVRAMVVYDSLVTSTTRKAEIPIELLSIGYTVSNDIEIQRPV